MAHFAAKQDSMGALLAGQSPPGGSKKLAGPDTAKKHYPQKDGGEMMADLMDGTGGPEAVEDGKRHFGGAGDVVEGGAVGLTTARQEPHKLSVKMVDVQKDHGDLCKQDIAPTDLSQTHHMKRMFDHKPNTESAPAQHLPAKRPRADLDGSSMTAALDPTAPALAPAPVPSKKQLEGASNKRDRVLGATADCTPPNPERKHFEDRGNEADGMEVVLQHPKSGVKAPRPERPAPAPVAPCTAPVAGLASEAVHLAKAAPKKLVDASNAPTGAGMTSTELNAPVKSALARAAPAEGAGSSSVAINHAERAVAPESGTAEASKKAMSGAAVGNCLSWGH